MSANTWSSQKSGIVCAFILLMNVVTIATAIAQNGKQVLPVDIVGRGVLGADGKQLGVKREEASQNDDSKVASLLREIESLTLKGNTLCTFKTKSPDYINAEKCFKQALFIYEVVERKSPTEFYRHVVDKAELMEAYALLLRKTKRESEAIKIETQAKNIRQSLVGKKLIRTYSNGYRSQSTDEPYVDGGPQYRSKAPEYQPR
ncbi:MAG: hypothetical protein K2X81_02440 [Candidatus Obscuribacterales bacterium]|nr:hypothetical protein [Candidatus Obscuribacterales bacterium]